MKGEDIVKHLRITESVSFSSNAVEDDGTITIKMGTIGVKNKNNRKIANVDSIVFDGGKYPLLFDHVHELSNVIGYIEPLPADGDDLMCKATITDAKAKEAIDNGSLRFASLSYYITEYGYDEEDDSLIIYKADFVELSLVLYPADSTATITSNSVEDMNIINVLMENGVVTKEEARSMLNLPKAAENKAKDKSEDDASDKMKAIKEKWGVN